MEKTSSITFYALAVAQSDGRFHTENKLILVKKKKQCHKWQHN